jgi:superfamily II DNA/RNA helicase
MRHHNREFRVATCYGGGTSSAHHIIRAGMEVLIGTPGRLIDDIKRGRIILNNVSTMAIDEAHAMLDINFLDDLRFMHSSIKKATTAPLQTILLSATLPSNLKELLHDICDGSYELIDLVKSLQNRTPSTVKHYSLRMPMELRANVLEIPIQKYVGSKGKVLIFAQRKRDVQDLATTPSLQDAQMLHGDMRQSARERAFHMLRTGEATRMVATNVAARGLDIPAVDLVVQLDPPETPDIYIHRAGRTARVGAKGTVISMWDTHSEARSLRDIQTEAGIKFQQLSFTDNNTKLVETGEVEDFTKFAPSNGSRFRTSRPFSPSRSNTRSRSVPVSSEGDQANPPTHSDGRYQSRSNAGPYGRSYGRGDGRFSNRGDGASNAQTDSGVYSRRDWGRAPADEESARVDRRPQRGFDFAQTSSPPQETRFPPRYSNAQQPNREPRRTSRSTAEPIDEYEDE